MTGPDAPPRRPHYNHAAGRSPARLAALSDGVFSIAMTLLVLELHAPAAAALSSEAALLTILAATLPKLLVWAMSFLTLGIFWVAQSTQIDALAKSDRDLTWLHLGFLAAVSLIPFTTALLGEAYRLHVAMLVYWFNVLLLGVLVWSCWRYARRHQLLVADWPQAMMAAVERRIVVSQAFYFAAMLMSLVRPGLGLVLMLAVQLNYAVAPRFGRWLG